MGEAMTTIGSRTLEALVAAGVVSETDAAAIAQEAAAREVALGALLLDKGLVDAAKVETVLETELGVPRVDLESYAPDDEALEIVPSRAARLYGVLPLFEIEGMLTVALGDPLGVFALDQMGAELDCEVEAVLADSADVAAAIDAYYPVEEEPEPEAEPDAASEVEDVDVPVDEEALVEEEVPSAEAISADEFFDVLGVTEPASEPEPESDDEPAVEPAAADDTAGEEPPSLEVEPSAAPESEEVEAPVAEPVLEAPEPDEETVDLDVLAVADERRVASLVSEILSLAVRRGASRIHVLPYKSDFFLVFRIQGRLEKIASAPLSLQQPLVDGFKTFARLHAVPAEQPALGRIRTEIGSRPLVLTVSSVPTVSGQRLVVSIGADREPHDLAELGMSEAEVRAMHAMLERGRGLLLVAAPVAGGRSTTYYSLLAHAAAVGKTVYSVEQSIEYEIPAVAQVLVNPGSAVGAVSYLAAGLRQDTDVVAIDSIQTAEEAHLAIEAAGIGRLVVATVAGADIAAAARRLLDMGAEPVSLASALTLGVGQRVVRTVCPECAQDEDGDLAERIPGAEDGLVSKSGAGCEACASSGFGGMTGIFEVLPFTESVRSAVARDGSRADIEAAARAAGMRPMSASGLAKVREGLVSAAELDRVLRFAEGR